MGVKRGPVAKWQKHKELEGNELDDIYNPPKKKKKKSKQYPDFKWEDRFYLLCYQLAKEGKSHKEVADAMGVDEHTLKRWRADRPSLEDAYWQGCQRASQTFQDYVYDRLSPKLQTLWDKIKQFDDHPNALQKITGLMANSGVRARQHLFIQALISRNFNASKALNSLGMSYQQLMTWAKNDPVFTELLNEIEWHRKNFYEDSLYNLVKEGNPAATIFVAKTKLKDRGYGAKLEIEHSGTVNHNHQMVDLETLNLPFEFKRQLLEYIEEAQIKALPAPKQDVIDAHFEVVEEEDDEAA